MDNATHGFKDSFRSVEFKLGDAGTLKDRTLDGLSNAEFAQLAKGATRPDLWPYGIDTTYACQLQREERRVPYAETRHRKGHLLILREEVARKPSATELAMRDFLERVKGISGVEVRLYGGKTLAEQTIVVEVPSIMGQEATDVILLKGDMYAKYPGSSIRVDITESVDIKSYDEDTVSVKR